MKQIIKNRTIEFQPGYWEWLVYINGKPVHSFGDLSEECYDDETGNPLTAEEVAENCVELWKDACAINEDNEDLTDDWRHFPLTQEEAEGLKNQMAMVLHYHWGI